MKIYYSQRTGSSINPFHPTGHFEGVRAQSHPQAVCSPGVRPGANQSLLPLRRKGTQEQFPGEVLGTEVPELRPVPVHPDHRHPHKDLRQHPELPR